MKTDINLLEKKSYTIRKRFVEIFSELGYGHLTTAFSEVEILVTMMEHEMKKEDTLFISKGHGAGLLFPIWEDMGIFNQEKTRNMVRPGGDFTPLKGKFYPGFEFYGGSLGIGLGMAAGMALGQKMNDTSANIYCLVGDAEIYEGSIWEAMVFSGHNNLDNLIVVVDRNRLGCSDFTENMCSLEPFSEKWESCGWEVQEVDGHSYEELIGAFEKAKEVKSCKPHCIVANTVKGKGAKYLCDIPLMHGFIPKGEEIKKVFVELEKEYGI